MFWILHSLYVRFRSSTQRRLFDRAGFTSIEVMIAVAVLSILAERALRVEAVLDIKSMSISIKEYETEWRTLPTDLAVVGEGDRRDPWGNPYEYLVHADNPPGFQRKDHEMVPINSTYDLYSAGPDGVSQPPLTANGSRDDVVRARDGNFIGRASDFTANN